MNYDTVIGLEVHAELSTKTKIFCSCETSFGAKPNTHTCPICLGLPGTLPVLNKKVVEYAVRAGLAVNCSISHLSKLDRKNYFYPDLPKAYQISQYDMPLCRNGYIELKNGKRVRINRIHIEEDAGKLVHSEEDDTCSLVDYNRVGVPLIEIVSEPDMTSPDEAVEYMEKLKGILEYIDVSDCKMQEGSLRCDANISLKECGSEVLGTKAELKNINSFKALHRAIEYEIDRQSEVLDLGQKVAQETRRWYEPKQKTMAMRSKEYAEDYRYFPDPDLVPVELSDDYIEEIKDSLPELPEDKKNKFISVYGLSPYEAEIITSSKYLADFFEKTAKVYFSPKSASNFITEELLRLTKDSDIEYKDIPVSPEDFGKLLEDVGKGKISVTAGKKVFEIMFETKKSPDIIIKEQGLSQISDELELIKMVEKVIENNSAAVKDCKDGKGKAIGFLIGQVMKASKGKANPKKVNELIAKYIK